MLMLNVVNGEKEEDDATRAPESGDKQPGDAANLLI